LILRRSFLVIRENKREEKEITGKGLTEKKKGKEKGRAGPGAKRGSN